MRTYLHKSNLHRVLVMGMLLTAMMGFVPSVFAQSYTPVGTGSLHASPISGGIPVTGGVSATRSSYSFTSRTNECGWGVNDGEVVNGKLYVSPGFNLRQWLKYNPGVTFESLQRLNKNLRLGAQFSCSTIELPSM